MIELALTRTFLTTSTVVSVVLVWYCWRWIRYQQKQAALSRADQAAKKQ